METENCVLFSDHRAVAEMFEQQQQQKKCLKEEVCLRWFDFIWPVVESFLQDIKLFHCFILFPPLEELSFVHELVPHKMTN